MCEITAWGRSGPKGVWVGSLFQSLYVPQRVCLRGARVQWWGLRLSVQDNAVFGSMFSYPGLEVLGFWGFGVYGVFGVLGF